MAATAASVPLNLFRPNAPLIGKALENYPIVEPGAPGDTRHIVLSLENSGFQYLEGQSIGIMPPGVDANGKPHKPRLYSIASTRMGDDGEGKTVSLSIKRLEYKHPETGELVKGVCSNFLCDLNPGDDVKITGPTGKTFLLPSDPKATLILIATGTGIAPFRSFMKHLFEEDAGFEGNIWLFFGVPTSSTLLYKADLERFKAKYGSQFRVDYAISREQKNDKGEKMYVQNRMAEYGDELWDLLQKDSTHTFICGLRGMEDGINEVMAKRAEAAGTTWPEFQKSLKKADRWHEETY
ncbi:MAG: ferredoxin--NADP(+) reductase [Synechococcales cyanobacterium]